MKKFWQVLLPLIFFSAVLGFISSCATVGPSGRILGECSSTLTRDWEDRIGADVGKLVAFGLDGIETKSWGSFARNAITHLAASYGQSGAEMVSCFLGLPNLLTLPIFGNIGSAAGDTDPRVVERLNLLKGLAP